MKNTPLIGLIAALSLIITSCDNKNELSDNESSSKVVAVRIRSLSVAEGSSESLTRSSLEKEPEIVSQPIGDGMLLEMSVKQDDSSLRAPQLLGDGKLFRVIAVNHGTNDYYSHGDFTVGIIGPSPSTDFHVKIGEKYDYICISYNSDTDLPPDDDYEVGEALEEEFAVDNTNDLLWCRINKDENVTASGVDLEILLKQKLAKVTVTIDYNYNNCGITGIATSKVGVMGIPLTCSMNWTTGSLTGTATEQWLTFVPPTLPYPKTLTSNMLNIIPTTSNATINFEIGAILRDGLTAVPSAKRSSTFTKALSAGVNYTITVRFRTPIFARSNIYWDDAAKKLTFVPAAIPPTINDDSKKGYQGVLFKWGSLVGVSPAQKAASNEEQRNAFNGDVTLFVPAVKNPLNTSTWKVTTGNNTGTDTDIDESVRHKYTSWTSSYVVDDGTNSGDIPYMDSSRGGNGIVDRGNIWLIDATRNDLTTYKGLRGDICQYLGETQSALDGYRLPTSYEFGAENTVWDASTPNSSGWVKGTDPWPSSANNAAGNGKSGGTANLLVAAENNGNAVYGSGINQTMGNVVFPASGNRNSIIGLQFVGERGFYWSGSAQDDCCGYILRFYDDYVHSNVSLARDGGFSVRCVKKIDPSGNY
jgi:hypothetical protein